MGMSATQARLLQLTSELNDLEYQGQQINMARSQLSSQSATYYNQLLNMEVPTAPNKTDFTNTVYTYSANGKDYTITNIALTDSEGNATVSTQYTAFGATVSGTGDKVSVSSTTNKVKDTSRGTICTTDINNLYTEDGSTYTPIAKATVYSPDAAYVDNTGKAVNVAAAVTEKLSTGNYVDENGNPITSYTEPMFAKGEEEGVPGAEISPELFFMSLGLGEVNQVVPETEATAFIGTAATDEKEYTIDGQPALTFDELPESDEISDILKAIKQTGKDPDDYYVIEKNGEYELFLKTDVQDSDGEAEVQSITYTDNALYEEDVNAQLAFGNNGRLSSITIDGQTIMLESQTELDEYAYNEAYEAYTYEKAVYDQDQAYINSQLSTIQAQDKRLELQLQDLDTERTQITTELDALETVLGDNVERTYKTFSG